jgi:hypothetical protein
MMVLDDAGIASQKSGPVGSCGVSHPSDTQPIRARASTTPAQLTAALVAKLVIINFPSVADSELLFPNSAKIC